MYHFRSSLSAEERYLADTNRAWRSLFLCGAGGAAALACVLSSPSAPPMGNPAGTTRAAITLWEQVNEPTPAAAAPTLKLQALPPREIALPTVPAAIPTLETADILPLLLPTTILLPEERGAESVLLPAPPTLGECHRPRARHKASFAGPPRHTLPRPLGEYTPPSYREAPEPPYPPALRAERTEGTVRVRIAVDAQGKPTKVVITQSSGHWEFDVATREWILHRWHFNPAHRGGLPIAGAVSTSIRFVMQ